MKEEVHAELEPEAGAALGARKAANLERTSAELIAAANPGCAVQIARYLARPIPIVHPIELLARSLSGDPELEV